MSLKNEERAAIEDAKKSVFSTHRKTVSSLEENLYQPTYVLDHGFVRVVDYMGDDSAVVQAARVSYGKGTSHLRDDRGLIRYLMRHRHTTPFEMCELKLHIKLPIFIARQWIRHRTACLTGETLLTFDVTNTSCEPPSTQMRMDEFHKRFQTEELPVLRSMNLRMCNEDSLKIEHTRVADIWHTGVKPVFQVTLENGASLTMTKDHRCFTTLGWKTLEQVCLLKLKDDGTVYWDSMFPIFWVGYENENQINHLSAEPFKIKDIEYKGLQDTYDLEVTGPYHNFIANGFVVHNSVNEYSGRYSILDKEFYLPNEENLGVQSSSNRQGRGDSLPKAQAEKILQVMKQDAEQCYGHYSDFMLENPETNDSGAEKKVPLSRELARMNLTLNYYTQWYWKINLHNLLHFLSLRMDSHAQYEIRVYAEAIGNIVKTWVPLCWEAFCDYRLHAKEFSKLELDALRFMLEGEKPNLTQMGLSKREQDEFYAKIGKSP